MFQSPTSYSCRANHRFTGLANRSLRWSSRVRRGSSAFGRAPRDFEPQPTHPTPYEMTKLKVATRNADSWVRFLVILLKNEDVTIQHEAANMGSFMGDGAVKLTTQGPPLPIWVWHLNKFSVINKHMNKTSSNASFFMSTRNMLRLKWCHFRSF